MRKYIFIIPILILIGITSCKQHNESEAIVDRLNAEAWELSSNNPKEAIKICEQALLIADSISYLKGQSDCHNRLGIFYTDISHFVEAEEHFLKAIPIRQKMKYFAGVGYVYDNLCRLRNEEGDYLEAIKYGFKGLNILEDLGLASNEPTLYLNLAIAHDRNKNDNDAIKYYTNGLEIANSLNDTFNMATIHFNWGKLYNKLKEFKKAEEQYNKALPLYLAIDYKIGIAAIKDEQGMIMHQQRDYEYALAKFEESKQINMAISDSVRLFHNYLNISNVHFENDDNKTALTYCDKAKNSLGNLIRLDVREMLFRTYSNIYAKIGNQNDHIIYYKKAEAIEDSIYNIAKNRNIAKLQKEQLEKENAQIEIENQKLNTSLVIASCFVLLSIFALYFLNQRRKNKEKKFIIYKEQQERSIDQGILNATRSVRKELSTNLHNHVSTPLTHIKRYLEPIYQKLSFYPDFQAEIFEAMTLVDKTHFTSRDIAYKLKPEELDWLDRIKVSVSALKIKKGVETYADIAGLNADTFSSSKGEKISSIICNLLSNADKHSKATIVNINIIQAGKQLNIEIEDNGVGFAPQKTNGIGLNSVQSDVKSLHGSINIKSQINKGTSVFIQIPATNE